MHSAKHAIGVSVTVAHLFDDCRTGGQHILTSPQLIIFSWVEDNSEASISALKVLSELAPRIPVIVLAYRNDAELARAAICHGAKGYIPVTMGFEITVEAVRFVLAGGTYVPMDCLLARNARGDVPSQPPTPGLVTPRELVVIRAIQKGKSNKVIAYDLNMSESTVKVHIRNIMKKLNAKNRTDVAIKSSELLKCSRCTMQPDCWSAGYCAERADTWGQQGLSQTLSCFVVAKSRLAIFCGPAVAHIRPSQMRGRD